MSTPKETTVLKKRLEAFSTTLRSNKLDSIATYFAPNADFRSSKGIVRGADKITAAADDMLRLRASADVLSIKWLSTDMAMVDSVAEAEKGRGWFTEIIRKGDGKNYLIDALRIRVGTSDNAYKAISALTPETIAGEVSLEVVKKEEAELRKRFKTFRAAFNKGDTKTLLELCATTVDAIPVFGFLDGRSQIMQGRAAVGAKADRMFGADVSNPNPTRQGASFIGGETKVLRFLSPTVVVVDGTAEISNIPSAHGFAPKEMRGVYSNVWRKSGGQWRCEGARAWF